MTPATRIPESLIGMLADAAGRRGILGGDRAGLVGRLGDLAAGLDVELPEKTPPARREAPSWRDIGQEYWRHAYRGSERRRLDGSVYTPEEVVRMILELIWGDLFPGNDLARGGTVCDPAMGCGYFLVGIVERLARAFPVEAVRRWAGRSLHGADLDAGAVFVTRALLWLLLSDKAGEFLPDAANFVRGDSLTGPHFAAATNPAGDGGLDWGRAFPRVAERGGFDVVVGNPPYEILTNFSRRPERRVLAEALRKSGYYPLALKGQVNLYRCFVERALRLVRPGGAVSMIVPLALARDAAALPLRRRLLEGEAADRWLLFGEEERVFPGVSQSACIFRAVREGGAAGAVVVTTRAASRRVPMDRLEKAADGMWRIPLVGGGGGELCDWLEENCPDRFGDIVDMRVGEVDQTVYRACMADADTGCLLARGAHLSPFRLDVEPTPGRERFLDLPLFLAMKGTTAADCARRAGERRVVQLGIRNMHTRPRLVAALAPPGVYIGNSLNVYLPRGGMELEYVAGLLNSSLLDWLFRLASANNNINLHEMRGLPAPSKPNRAARGRVVEAYRACVGAAGHPDALRAARADLDAAVIACYGVPEPLLRRWREEDE